MKGPRYAVYFAPRATSALARLGAGWLGRDADSGQVLAQPEVAGLAPERLAQLTAAPRRYGFHATLKAPFHLAPCVRRDDVAWLVGLVANELSPVTLPKLRVSRLGAFIALTPEREEGSVGEQALRMLEEACVQRLDPFRAALSERDLRRRDAASLSESERQHLRRWGYPYVLDAFRFHLTLSDKVYEDDAALLVPFLEDHFRAVLRAPLTIDGLSLFEQQDRNGPFQRIVEFPLVGQAKGRDATVQGKSDAA